MNTVGNLGGFAAGVLTGGHGRLVQDVRAKDTHPRIHEATKTGWDINFVMFGGVYRHWHDLLAILRLDRPSRAGGRARR